MVKWGLPGAMLGGFLGAVLFSSAPAEWIQIVVGLFLVSTILRYRFGQRERTFDVAKWWFFPAELVTGFLDGLIGAVGPVMAGQLWLFGLAAGIGALASNWLAKRLLKDMAEVRFRAIVVGFMALSGIVMIWQQRETLASLI